ncbi:hypothetical protein PV326_011654, partial [Microctonus aethiopoides]
MGHTGRNNRGGKSQSWSRQSNPSNNNENNNSGNWRPRGRGRSMRGNIHRGGKVASSSQFNSSSSANDDSFDWGSGSTTTNQNSSSTNNTDATAFDWGTGGTSTNENVSSINNTDAGAFDWGTSGASTNNTNTNEFDWGTSGESSDRNEISTNNRDNNTQGWKRNRAGQPINNNRGGRSQSWSRSNSSNNRNNDSGNWRSRGGGRSTRGNFNQRSASSSQQFNSSNNAEDDSFDWGTGGNSTSQNKSATDNTDAGAFDWGTGGGSTNHNESSTNNANDTFDWGTSATSTNQNETSTNNTNADTYDWGTNSGSTGQDDTLTNNANDDTYDFKRNKSWQSSGRNNRGGRAQSWSSRRSSLSSNGDNNSSNWRPRGRGRGGRDNFNRRSSSSSQQFNSTSDADDNSFDWETGASSTNQNESTTINNTDAAAFDWGTGDVSTKQNETSNNTNDDNWGRNKNDQSRRNSRGNRSQSWSRQSGPNNNSCQDNVDDDASFDWGTGPSTQSANQSTSMNNANDDNSEWGTATGFTSQSQDVSCNGDNDASTDWQTLEPSLKSEMNTISNDYSTALDSGATPLYDERIHCATWRQAKILMDMNMKSDQDNNYNENSGTHDNHSTMVLNKALPSTSNENGLQITEQSSSATCVTSTNCCLTNYNNSVNDDVPINQVTTSSELQSNEITCYSDAVNQINCHSITTAISNHNDVESNGEMSILHNNYQNGSENLSDKTSDNGENIEATVAAGTSSIQNMLKKKQFMQEITISNSVSLSDNNSQSFISTTKEPIRKNIIRKKEFLKNNRRPDSEDLSGNKLNDYQNCTNYHSLDLQNEKLTRGIHVLDNEPCSSTGQINLSTSICDEASSLPLELPNLDSTDSDSIIVTQKPFKLPSLVNLFEAAEAQRIELEENASGSIDPLSLTHHREMDGAQALNPDSSEGSNSDTESQRANDVHRSEVAKKRVRSMNGTMSQDRVEYYHLWRSTGGQSSMPETLYDNLYTDPPPLPPRTAHRPLHRRNALPASLTCKRHYKHSTP